MFTTLGLVVSSEFISESIGGSRDDSRLLLFYLFL